MQRVDQRGRCLRALHQGRHQHHGDVGHAAAQRGDHVVQRGSPRRSHHANAARQRRQAALARRIEEAFGLQLRLQPQELLEQCALACTLHAFDDQLQITALLVDTQPAPQLDQLAIARRKVHELGRAPEHSAADLPAGVLDAEVAMAAGRAREAADLAAHRHRIEARLQSIAHGAAQRADFPDQRRRCWIHCAKCTAHAGSRSACSATFSTGRQMQP